MVWRKWHSMRLSGGRHDDGGVACSSSSTSFFFSLGKEGLLGPPTATRLAKAPTVIAAMCCGVYYGRVPLVLPLR